MRVGKRSPRIRLGDRGELIRLAIMLVAAAAEPAYAGSSTVGPARIVCNASFCEMGSSARPKERVRVIISELPHDEVKRLRKCTGVSKPCIVTIDGAEQGSPTRIMASTIRWQGQD